MDEYNLRVRQAKDKRVIGWILEKIGDKYNVVLDDDSEKIYSACDIPKWMSFLFSNGIGIEGREHESSEIFAKNGDDYDVAEILVRDKSGNFLIRFCGFQMTDAVWVRPDELENCVGLMGCYFYELDHNKGIRNMRPTRRWLSFQGAGSRSHPKRVKSNKTQYHAFLKTKFEKNPKWAKKQLAKFIYKQTCLYDCLDSVYPNKIPKKAARDLRNATKLGICEFKDKLQKVLAKYRTNLVPEFIFEYDDCNVELGKLLKKYNTGTIFVVYQTNLQFHTGIYSNGGIQPYTIHPHSKNAKKDSKDANIDDQENFKQAQNCICRKIIGFRVGDC